MSLEEELVKAERDINKSADEMVERCWGEVEKILGEKIKSVEVAEELKRLMKAAFVEKLRQFYIWGMGAGEYAVNCFRVGKTPEETVWDMTEQFPLPEDFLEDSVGQLYDKLLDNDELCLGM